MKLPSRDASWVEGVAIELAEKSAALSDGSGDYKCARVDLVCEAYVDLEKHTSEVRWFFFDCDLYAVEQKDEKRAFDSFDEMARVSREFFMAKLRKKLTRLKKRVKDLSYVVVEYVRFP